MNHNTGTLKSFYFIMFIFFSVILISCSTSVIDADKERKEINIVLDAWNKAAAKADYDTYFSYLADDAIFIGTDASENWDKKLVAF